MHALFWLIFSAILALAAFVVAWHQLALVRRGVRTTGRIVRWEKDEDDYVPTVEYRLPDGRVRSFRSACGWAWRTRRAGSPVPVIYDPANPGRVEIDGFFAHWLAPVGIGSLAFVFAVAAIRGAFA